MLAEIATAGLRRRRLPRLAATDGAGSVHLYAAHGQSPAPGYLSGDFLGAAVGRFDPGGGAKDYARFAKAVGCTELYVAASGFNWVIPTWVDPYAALLRVSSLVTLSGSSVNSPTRSTAPVKSRWRRGCAVASQPRVGTVIETGEEGRLFALLDPDLVFMGPDTGHLAWAGVDVVSFCRDYADRILTMHIKDIDPNVLAQGVAAEWDYGQFSDNGVFTELGLGFVDFPTVFDILDKAGFDGWLIVETDVTQQETAYESADEQSVLARLVFE
ncbi:MAG: sugar phosphate isomerase/epimerase [Caldilineaceae bacterium]